MNLKMSAQQILDFTEESPRPHPDIFYRDIKNIQDKLKQGFELIGEVEIKPVWGQGDGSWLYCVLEKSGMKICTNVHGEWEMLEFPTTMQDWEKDLEQKD